MATQLAPAYAELGLFIGGEWLSAAGRKTSPVVNPATEEVLGNLPHATKADLDRALAEAEKGFKLWRAVFPDARGKILKRAAELMRERAEEIARIATTESGKSIHETRIEVQMSANIFEWFAEEGRRAYGRVLPQRTPGTRLAIVKEPVGPVAAFAPWNFPIGNPARKIGAALGAGCSCILKPAEETPASGLAVARCLVDAGLPAGVLAIVYGVPAEISEHLLASPIIRKVSFTGSIPVGKHLMKLAAEGMKRTTMELGGHAPVLVFDDVDVEKVLDACVVAKYRNAGQVCVSPTRFYVHEKIYNRFVEGFAARAKALPVGDGINEKNKMGPLVHARRLAAIESLIEDAKNSGAKLQAGGTRLKSPGYFYAPTVLSDVPNKARIMNEEPFGPVALINSFSDYDSVIREANRLPYGLAAFAFTNSAHRAKLVGEQLEAGMVGVNTFQISVPESPFGGVKESGHGSEEGIEGLEACLVTKFISEA
ncbi:MAG: NAD-dependent succinate-semialdehyde dehydrogenase [Candidatus Acidiferrales bacterium]